MAWKRISPWGRDQYLVEDLGPGESASGGFPMTAILFFILFWYLGYRTDISPYWAFKSKIIVFGIASLVVSFFVCHKSPNFPANQYLMAMMLIVGISWFPGINEIVYKDGKMFGLNDGYAAPLPQAKQPMYFDFRDGKGPVMTFDGEKWLRWNGEKP